MRTTAVFAALISVFTAFPHALAGWTDAAFEQTHLRAAPPPVDDPFIKCLKVAGLDPVARNSSSYAASLSGSFNSRLPWRPLAIVFPSDANGVANAVQCGAAHKVKVNALCGGHSYSAFGLGGEDGHLTVSLENLRNLSMAGTTATIGGGNRLGDVALYLWNHGRRALAHGTCPYVGIGGHAGQGGFGLASRLWGLLSDQISSIEIVIANGTILTASAHQNPDLFWAAMGAGSSFGIITSFRARTHPAMDSVAFAYTFTGFSADESSKGLQAWQTFVSNRTPDGALDPELGLQLHIHPADDSRPAGVVFSLTGQYYGVDNATVDTTMAPLIQQLGKPSSIYMKNQNWIESVLYLSGTGSTDINSLNTTQKPDKQNRFFATSTFVSQNDVLRMPSTQALMNHLYGSDAGRSPVPWFMIFELYGGPLSFISTRGTDYNSFNARDALYSIKYYGSIPPASNVSDADTIQFIQGMKDAIERNQNQTTFKEYVNYIDSTYTPGEAHQKYYPTHTERLTAIKQKYDPHRVIHHPQDF